VKELVGWISCDPTVKVQAVEFVGMAFEQQVAVRGSAWLVAGSPARLLTLHE